MASGSVLGLFSEAADVAKGVAALRQAGLTDANFEVLTDAPYPEGTFGEGQVRHRLPVWSLVGAFCGFVCALALTIGTQLAYPLPTGGKPILSVPPMLLIWFEGTMLGAILMTFLGFFFEARLPRGSLGLYDPRINDGYIGLLVHGAEPEVSLAEETLRNSGAEEVLTQEE